MVKEKHIGWVIVKEHGEENSKRIGYGQGVTEANSTAESHNAAVGRTIFMLVDIDPKEIPSDKRVKWRSFSDDGDPAYDGIVNIDWLYPTGDLKDFEDDDPAYNIDRFVMNDWGATIVAYNKVDIRRCRPDLAEYVANHPKINPESDWVKEAGIDADSWITIYG